MHSWSLHERIAIGPIDKTDHAELHFISSFEGSLLG